MPGNRRWKTWFGSMPGGPPGAPGWAAPAAPTRTWIGVRRQLAAADPHARGADRERALGAAGQHQLVGPGVARTGPSVWLPPNTICMLVDWLGPLRLLHLEAVEVGRPEAPTRRRRKSERDLADERLARRDGLAIEAPP